MLSDKTLRYGEEVCAVTLGVDHLYRKEIGVGIATILTKVLRC